jgi:hypothetical protein
MKTFNEQTILSKTRLMEEKYDLFELPVLHRLIKYYINVVEISIDSHHDAFANDFLLKAYRTLTTMKEQIIYMLEPGLSLSYKNERLLNLIADPLYAHIYYYDAYLISKSRQKKGLSETIDKALYIFEHHKKTLSINDRKILLKTLELKRGTIPFDALEQIPILKQMKRLFRNPNHMYKCHKEIGDVYYMHMKFKDAIRHYLQMEKYAKKINVSSMMAFEPYFNSLERLVYCHAHLSHPTHARNIIYRMSEVLSQTKLNIEYDLLEMLLPHQLLIYMYERFEDIDSRNQAYLSMLKIIEEYRRYYNGFETVISSIYKAYDTFIEHNGTNKGDLI